VRAVCPLPLVAELAILPTEGTKEKVLDAIFGTDAAVDESAVSAEYNLGDCENATVGRNEQQVLKSDA
jgi:hypothetical protein